MRLYNWEKKIDEDISPDLATGLIKAGTHSPYNNDNYVVVDDVGTTTVVKGNKLYDWLDRNNTIPTKEIYDEALEGNKYDNSNLEAAAVAAIRALSFGSDGILLGMGVQPETIRKLKKYNPYLTNAVEFGTLAGTMMMPGLTAVKGAGLAAKALRGAGAVSKVLPTNIASKATLKLGNVAAKALGPAAATSGMAKNIADIMGAGLGTAVEGSIYGVGSYLNEDTLGNSKFSGEALFANAMEGAKWGGILGAGFTGAGKVLAGGAKKIMSMGEGKPPPIPDEAIDPTKPIFAEKKSMLNRLGVWLGKAVARIPEDVIESYMANPSLYDDTLKSTDLASKITFLREEIESAINSKKQSADSVLRSIQENRTRLEEIINDKTGEVKRLEAEIKDLALQDRLTIERNLVQEDDVIHASNIISSAREQAKVLNDEAFSILENVNNELVSSGKKPIEFNGKYFLKLIKEARNKRFVRFDKKGNPLAITPLAITVENQDTLNYINKSINMLEGFINESGGKLDLPIIKRIIQEYQKEATRRGGKGAWGQGSGQFVDLQFAKDVQRILNNFLYNSMSKIGDSRYLNVMDNLSWITENLARINKSIGYADDPEFIGNLRKSLSNAIKGNIEDSVNYEYIRELEDILPAGTIYKNRLSYLGAPPTKTLSERMNANKIEYQYTLTKGLEKQEADALRVQNLYPEELMRYIIADDELRNLKLAKSNAGTKLDDYLNSEVIRPFEKIEQYANIKEGVIQHAQILDEIKKLEERMAPFRSWGDVFNNERKVNLSLTRDDKVKAVFGKMAEMSDPEILEMAKILRVQDAFNKSAINGSRNVQAFKTIIGGLASLVGLGITGGPIGMAIGAFIGYNLDVYGPKIMKRILRLISEMDGTITKDKVRKIIIQEVPEMNNFYNDAKNEIFKKVEKDRIKSLKTIRDASKNFFKISPLINASRVFTAKEIIEDKNSQEFDYNDQLRKYRNYLNNRENVNTNFYDENDTLSLVIPNSTNSAFETYQRATSFLESKFPKPTDADILNEYKPSALELYKFSQYANYINKPKHIFDEINNGIISDEGIEVLSNVYPEHYNVLIEELSNNFDIESVKKMPMSKRTQLQLALGLDLGANLNYNNIMMLQGGVQREQEQQEQEQMKKLNKKFAETTKSEANRLMT